MELKITVLKQTIDALKKLPSLPIPDQWRLLNKGNKHGSAKSPIYQKISQLKITESWFKNIFMTLILQSLKKDQVL